MALVKRRLSAAFGWVAHVIRPVPPSLLLAMLNDDTLATVCAHIGDKNDRAAFSCVCRRLARIRFSRVKHVVTRTDDISVRFLLATSPTKPLPPWLQYSAAGGVVTLTLVDCDCLLNWDNVVRVLNQRFPALETMTVALLTRPSDIAGGFLRCTAIKHAELRCRNLVLVDVWRSFAERSEQWSRENAAWILSHVSPETLRGLVLPTARVFDVVYQLFGARLERYVVPKEPCSCGAEIADFNVDAMEVVMRKDGTCEPVSTRFTALRRYVEVYGEFIGDAIGTRLLTEPWPPHFVAGSADRIA